MARELFQSLPLQATVDIDQLCSQFERQWKSGETPRIEDFLQASTLVGTEREALLQQLLLVELQLQAESGQTLPPVADYVRRFPDYFELVTETYRDSAPVENSPQPTTAPPANLGRVGQYRLLEKLGQGGMGAVYKAQHVELVRIVAVKLLPAERMRHPDAVERFKREVKAVGRLDHPNIVGAFDAGEADGRRFLVMEFVDGLDLAKLVKSCGPLPIAEACELIRQAAIGLQHAHEHGLVHRDVKPSNLVVVTGGTSVPVGTVKVLDLGLARLRAEAAEEFTTLTSTGQVMGTMGYMAPEQLTDAREVDVRADVFSLGCTLYKLLTGHSPTGGEERLTVYAQILAALESQIVPVTQVRPDVPPDLVQVLDKMLAQRPEDRFATPIEVARALEPFCAGHQLEVFVRATIPKLPDETALASTISCRAADDSSRHEVQPAVPAGKPMAKSAAARWRRGQLIALAVFGFVVLLGITIVIRDRLGGEKGRITAESGDIIEIQEETTAAPRPDHPQPPGGGDTEGGVPRPNGGPLVPEAEPDTAGPDALRPGQRAVIVAQSDSSFVPSPVVIGPAVPRPEVVKPNLVPKPIPEYKPGQPVDSSALVARPSPVNGVLSWTILPKQPRAIVTSLALNPDETLLAVSTDSSIRFWDVSTGLFRRAITFGPDVSGYFSLDWSPDGKYLAATRWYQTVILDVQSGQDVLRLKSQLGSCCWSPDGRLLAYINEKNLHDIAIWDTLERKVVCTLRGHFDRIHVIEWSPDGTKLATGSGYDGTDRTARVWNVATGELLATFQHSNNVYNLGWSLDGKVLCTRVFCEHAYLWNVAERRQLDVIPGGGGGADRERPFWTQDGRRIYLPGSGLWDLCERRFVNRISWGHVRDSVATHDGSACFEGLFHGALIRTSIDATPPIIISPKLHKIEQIRWLPNQKRLVSVHSDGGKMRRDTLWCFDGEDVMAPWTTEYGQVAPSRDGKHLAVMTPADGVHVWDLEGKTRLAQLDGSVRSLAADWSHDGSILATADNDSKVRLWDVRQQALVKELVVDRTNLSGTTHLRSSPDGRWLAMGVGSDSPFRLWLWSQTDWQQVGEPNDFAASLWRGPIWSPDGNELATENTVIRIEDRSSKKLNTSDILDWSPDGKTFLVCNVGTTSVVDTQTLKSRILEHGHAGWVQYGQFSSDGSLAATTDEFGYIWIRDVATGGPLTVLMLLADGRPLAISADGHFWSDGDVREEIVYLVQTTEGQVTLTPDEFEQKYGWKNDPSKVQFRAPPAPQPAPQEFPEAKAPTQQDAPKSKAPQASLPEPKEGLLIPKSQVDVMRQRVLGLEDQLVLATVQTDADRIVAEWPQVRTEIEKHVGQLLDVRAEHNPREFVPAEALAAAEKLDPLLKDTAKLGFVYFLTGERKYTETAAEILDMAGRVPRWGWFNWDGTNMPQIHFGMFARSAAFAVDFCWEAWSADQRQRVAQILAERCVEPYWRLVSLAPFMALHHLRAKNQGHNALSGALLASLALGGSHPDNSMWSRSLLQTYSWLVAHDIGWAGTNLSSGLPGYWDISMSNLYTAAACLNNARGIDFRVHPGFAEATWYPVMKEATVPFAPEPFDKPYPKDTSGLSGIIQHKPIELPSTGFGGPWWYDYAAQFPQSPATYFITKQFGRVENPHQDGHFELMDLLWVRTMPKPERPPLPTLLFKTTNREAMFRNGYGSPHTFLSFNGDCFLSARNEVLGCTSGLSWHFPWHQFAVTESALETEGCPFSPSMLITDSFDSPQLSAIGSKSWMTNVTYYPRPEQTRSHQEYDTRTRDILYVRSDRPSQVRDYFLFIDRVAHGKPGWHAFNWHIWNRPGNEGSYEILDTHTAIARRPNAALLLASLSHDQVAFEQQGIPSQPTVRYEFDHNALLLRAIAGGSKSVEEPVRTLPGTGWSAGEMLELAGRQVRHFVDFKALQPVLTAPLTLTPGTRYRLSMLSRKKNAWVDDNTLWVLDLDLLDAEGRPARKLEADPRAPDPLRLADPASGTRGECDWREAVSYFDAPPGVASARATLRFAQYTNNGPGITQGSELWLGEIKIEPQGIPERRDRDVLVTLVMPLEHTDPRPSVNVSHTRASPGTAGASLPLDAEILHPDGTTDRITIDGTGGVHVQRDGAGERVTSGWNVMGAAFGDLHADRPLHLALAEREGQVSGRVMLLEKSDVSLAGKSRTLEAGTYVYDGDLRLDPGAITLSTNSVESQQALKQGLAKLAEAITAERDRPLTTNATNLAIDADVTASGVRDPRFDPEHVIDNQTWEFPIDGVVDYALGEIETPGNGGYGHGAGPSYTENLSTWPLYVRPTYWLLPPRQTGSLTLKLKQSAPVRLIRLLNTTNAGLNDFATVDFEVELLDDAQHMVSQHTGSFGRVWDGAFRAAFANPKFFSHYGAAFSGMLEPGVKVPFGGGWQEIVVAHPVPIRYVRVHVRSHWAMGGGLNEVQVYP